MARLLRSNIQVPVRQMAPGTPFSVPAPRDSKERGEVKPPKCPTRYPKFGGFKLFKFWKGGSRIYINNLDNVNDNPFLTPRGSARQFFQAPHLK